MKRLLLLGLLLAAAAGVRLQQEREVAAWRAHALELEAEAVEGIARVGDALIGVIELRNAAAPTLIGPDAPRARVVPPAQADPVAAIADFHRRLEAEGIELVVLPAPGRYDVAPRMFGPLRGPIPPTAAQYARPHREAVRALRRAGVEVLDILPRLQRRARRDPASWVHTGDQHWTMAAVIDTAQRLAAEISDRPWADELPPLKTRATWKTHERRAPVGLGSTQDVPTQSLRVRAIATPDGKPLPARFRNSPVTIIGDSNVGWYQNFEADIAAQIAHELQGEVDLLAVYGGGATPCREALAVELQDPAYRSSRRMVVWVFMMGEMLRRPWGITPLDPPPPTRLAVRAARASDRLVVVRDGAGGVPDPHWNLPVAGTRWLKGRRGGVRFDVIDADRWDLLSLEIAAKQPTGPEPLRMVLSLNGSPLGAQPLRAGTQRVELQLEPGTLLEGANTLQVHANQHTGGGRYSIGLRSLELRAQP